MPADKIFYMNGEAIKGVIDLEQYPNSAWDWISNPPKDQDEEIGRAHV